MKLRPVLLLLGFFLLILTVCSGQFPAGLTILTGSAPAASLPGSSPPAFAREHPPGRELAAREQALVNELIKLDLQLEKYGRESSLLAARLEENLELTEKTRTELSRTRLLLARERRRLGGLLAFHYRYGQVSFLNLLLGTHTFSEFVNQSFYLSAFIARQAKIIRETRRLAAESEARLARLEQLQVAIANEKEQLARAIAEMEKLRAARGRLLADVRRQSVELAGRLLLMEEQWQKVLSGLRAVMQRISALPPGQLFPDRLSFSGGKLKAEIGAATFNRLLAAAAGDDFETLAVHISPDGVAISGALGGAGTPTAVPFTLKGNFLPDSGGRKVSLCPQALEINNVPAEKEILAFLAGTEGISWDLGESFPSLKILEITPGEDKIIFAFTGNL
ncbi:MAG: hypothetical protein K6U04_09910 [Armatimonadetes bacterium]|nr:hypothetical protein [Armatimonadota bacterium]